MVVWSKVASSHVDWPRPWFKRAVANGRRAGVRAVLTALGPVLGLDRPGFQSYLDFTAEQPVGSVPGPFRPIFGHKIPANVWQFFERISDNF